MEQNTEIQTDILAHWIDLPYTVTIWYSLGYD